MKGFDYLNNLCMLKAWLIAESPIGNLHQEMSQSADDIRE